MSIATIKPTKLAAYLEIVIKQRERALEAAKRTYGDDSAVCAELSKDVADITQLIAELRQPTFPGFQTVQVKK